MIAGRAETCATATRSGWSAIALDLQEVARQLGWSFVVHHTDRPAEEALLAIHSQLCRPGPRLPLPCRAGATEPAATETGAGS